MPTPVVNLENMRKHLTPAEKAARAASQKAMTRDKVRLTAPRYIKEDLVAHATWRSTVRRMKGITLLDDLDTEMLAAYCQILSRRESLSEIWRSLAREAAGEIDRNVKLAIVAQAENVLKRLEAQERLALAYGEKLGLTPSGRVRLAKRRAEEKQVDPEADLYGDGD